MKQEHTKLLYEYPLIYYAALHWGHHARQNEETTSEMVQIFLTLNLAIARATAVLLQDKSQFGHARDEFGQIHPQIIHQLLTNGRRG